MPFSPEKMTTLVELLLDQINRGLRFEDIFANLYEHIRDVVPCDRIAVALLDADGEQLRLVAAHADGEQALKVGYADHVAGSTLDELLRTGRPRIINDLPNYLAQKPQSRSTRLIVREGMKANLTLPLLADGRPIGVVFFSSRKVNVYRDEHAQLLKRIAGHLAISVEKAQLIATLEEQNRELQAASEIKQRFVAKLQEEVDKQTAEIRQLKQQLEQENTLLRSRLGESSTFALLQRLPNVSAICRAIEQVAAADTTVLVLGETGVGKELVVRAIHELSPRRDRLLVPLNCAALPEGLLPAELLGFEPGAFTGANRRYQGRFELAHRGTLFLDEIAELDSSAQVLLLRVLQERVIERLGGSERIPVDVRVIAATNKDLPTAIEANRFRADLFYRLNVFPIRVPPLRERRDDLPHLVEHFLQQFSTRMGKQIRSVSSANLDRLLAYTWPGNIRELENIIERAMIVSTGPTLELDPAWLPCHGPAASAWQTSERQTILDALHAANGKLYGRGGAAERLGLKGSTLASKMKKLGIQRER